jgi:two-component system, NarL family, invasion response regulator UvrY
MEGEGDAAIRVLVADDQAVFRDAMCDVILATPGMALAGDVDSGEAAVAAVEQLAPRLVIMDKRMPGIGGIEAARRIRALGAGVVVVLVSVEVPDSELLTASGAAAFLNKRELSPRALTQLWQAYGT